MTFSIAAKCRRTGMFGLAITTSSMAVGSRCCFARAGVGAVLSQNKTDPRLGLRAMDSLAKGESATKTMELVTSQGDGMGWRQLAIVDIKGDTAFFHGDEISSIHGHGIGDACVAVGNILRSEKVPNHMVRAFEAAHVESLPNRLLAALDAGLEAGGEIRELTSAALLVVHKEEFPLIDLRVDLDRKPLRQLRMLWGTYEPMMDLIAKRVFAPNSA